MKFVTLTFVLLVTCGVIIPQASAGPWVFTMADTVYVSKNMVHFSDLSSTQLPSVVAPLIACSSGQPGTVQEISRHTILRHLVSEGAASGVSFKGPKRCFIVRTGTTLDPQSLRPGIRRVLQPFVPAAIPGAPATWFELTLPTNLGACPCEDYEIKLGASIRLNPGRNHISIDLVGCEQKMNFPVTVILHQFNESARAKIKIKRGESLQPQLFHWEWVDLADAKQNTDYFGREGLKGYSSTRALRSGAYLRQGDLKSTPVIMTGDLVELMIERGAVSVSVRATARQQGSIGQTIPVRNELNKRLVNARVVAAGVVKWRN